MKNLGKLVDIISIKTQIETHWEATPNLKNRSGKDALVVASGTEFATVDCIVPETSDALSKLRGAGVVTLLRKRWFIESITPEREGGFIERLTIRLRRIAA